MYGVELFYTTMDCDQLPEPEESWSRVADGDHSILWWRPKPEPSSSAKQDEPFLQDDPPPRQDALRRSEERLWSSAQYCVYAMKWILGETNVEELNARWAREKSKRNQLNLDPAVRDLLETEKRARVAELKAMRGYPRHLRTVDPF
jgi:hypothetical protein